jgi:hypothetical protein
VIGLRKIEVSGASRTAPMNCEVGKFTVCGFLKNLWKYCGRMNSESFQSFAIDCLNFCMLVTWDIPARASPNRFGSLYLQLPYKFRSSLNPSPRK